MPFVKSIRVWGAAVIAAAAILSGCGQPPDYPPDLTFPTRDDRLVLRTPADRQPASLGETGKLDVELAALDQLGGRTVDPASAPADHRVALDRFLTDTFGTPASPTVRADDQVTAITTKLGLTPEPLAEGGRLYRRRCLHCHGLPGDGRGPSGYGVYPPQPRDFRRGSFKFVSTGSGGKPRKTDLARTLREGLKGTAMPPFGLMPAEQRDLLVQYVIYLSIRGEVEFQTLRAMLTEGDGGESVEGDPAGFARERLAAVVRDWNRAASTPAGPTPPPTPDDAGKQAPSHLDSVARGYHLFTDEGGTGCIKCHQDFGRKSGYWYDVWGTAVRPHNLTTGGFKGGNESNDLYQRIRSGILPSGMPAHPTLTDTQVWDLVNFVRALPYPRELPPAVRARVYPETQ